MPKELGGNSYRTYCRNRLVVSDSANKVYVEHTIEKKEKTKVKTNKKSSSLIIR